MTALVWVVAMFLAATIIAHAAVAISRAVTSRRPYDRREL